MKQSWELHLNGIVQGVGFRPFVARQAARFHIFGDVQNTSFGVCIHCEAEEENLRNFFAASQEELPPGAALYKFEKRPMPIRHIKDFRILPSTFGQIQTLISPDLGICEDCAKEVLDPKNRRYHYPFTNCTACGPRYTILHSVPYDRLRTTMHRFSMCEACQREYENTKNRRYHAQPNACKTCGPEISFVRNGKVSPKDPLWESVNLIKEGKILAIRGLGGYHLACDAQNEKAVKRLRQIKEREQKPFAVMVRDISLVKELCICSKEEEQELLSSRKAIVLLKKKEAVSLAPSIAEQEKRLGIFLPYTPLHLLLTQYCPILVMTSANFAGAPMLYQDADFSSVVTLSDGVLTHNRQILRRMDDSVCAFVQNKRLLFRRARGFVPAPLKLPDTCQKPSVLSFGAHLKNTFCLTKDSLAYLSGHIGDLDHPKAYMQYKEEIKAYTALFGIVPALYACDLHPDYASTQLAHHLQKQNPTIPLYTVQHHHAHFASVLAEHKLSHALGFIFDGSGFGTDGTVWGGEVLLGNIAKVKRVARLRPFPLIGADKAVKEVWRLALALLADTFDRDTALGFFKEKQQAPFLLQIKEKETFSPRSSSMGRLFDAVAVLCGAKQQVSQEGEDAVWLENQVDPTEKQAYKFTLKQDETILEIDYRPVIKDILADREKNIPVPKIAAKFHQALAQVVKEIASFYPKENIVLSGGCFQNLTLVETILQSEAQNNRTVYINEQVPCGDGGICLGQTAVALAKWEEEKNVSGNTGSY